MILKKNFLQEIQTFLKSNNIQGLKEVLANHHYYELDDKECYLVCLGFHKISDFISSNNLITKKVNNLPNIDLKKKFLRLEIFNLFFLRQYTILKNKAVDALCHFYDPEIIRVYYLSCRSIDDYKKYFSICKKNIYKNIPRIEESLNLLKFLKENNEYVLLSYLLIKIYKSNKKNSFILEEIAKNYFVQKKYILSKRYYKKLILTQSTSANLLNLANISNFLRENNDRNVYLSKCFKKDPDNLEAVYFSISNSLTTDLDENIEQLRKKESFLKNNMELLYFSLSKLYEKKKDFKNSFLYFTKANQVKNDKVNFDIYRCIKETDFFLKYFNKKDVISSDNSKYIKTPIFIVGLPRSGTTLVEHILGSHAKVKHFGETSYFFRNFKFLFNVYNLDQNDLIFEKYTSADYLSYGNLYLDFFPLLKEKTHFTDKMPFNFFYLGLIKYSLPHSKIIICRRDYRDVGLSILKNYFAEDVNFAYSEQNIIDYSINFNRTILGWKEIFKDNLFELNYEELVNNPKNKVIDLLKFCDLNYDPDCINFYKKKLTTDTVSVNQVTEGFYDNSIGAWKNFYNYCPNFFDSLNDIK